MTEQEAIPPSGEPSTDLPVVEVKLRPGLIFEMPPRAFVVIRAPDGIMDAIAKVWSEAAKRANREDITVIVMPESTSIAVGSEVM